MKIIVSMKQVPVRDSQLRIRAGGRWIEENDLSFEINEPDAYALEEALQLKEKHGGEVVALCAGPARASQTFREALPKGADRAIPIEEKNNVKYRSKNTGVMHACGHDVHTSSLLGAAKILNELKNEFSGTVKLIFQPGEEKAPGGALLMIKEGVLENPKPEKIFAQHVFPSLEVGKVGFRGGKYMASTDEIYLTVKGKGGHAAMKGTYVSPLLIASKILLELEKNFSKNKIPTVLAFGRMHAYGATNVIPDEVKIDGTLRTMDEKWRKQAQKIISSVCKSVAKKMKGNCEVNILNGYPALVNDNETTALAKKSAEEFLGKKNVVNLDLRMTGEDFSFFAQKIPACFYRLGTGNKSKGITSGVHTPTFDIDESALKTGMGLMAWIAISELKK